MRLILYLTVPEMTYIASSGALNSTHSLINHFVLRCFDTVGWAVYRKNYPHNDLLCVRWDVKPHSLTTLTWGVTTKFFHCSHTLTQIIKKISHNHCKISSHQMTTIYHTCHFLVLYLSLLLLSYVKANFHIRKQWYELQYSYQPWTLLTRNFSPWLTILMKDRSLSSVSSRLSYVAS